MRTVGQILDENKGMGKGFGFLRIALAVTIIAWHSFVVSQGDRASFEYRYFWISNYALLPMFFGLSGFLIAGSAQRLSIGHFFLSRALRIFPALAVETVISAVLIGPMVTALALSDYFQDPGFFRYFQNMWGAVVYTLPGVTFLPPYPEIVNGVIWTVPIELACYVAMGALIFSRLNSRPIALILIGIALLALPNAIEWFGLVRFSEVLRQSNHLWFFDNIRGDKLLPCFLFGVAAYGLRHRIAYSKIVSLLSLTALVLLGSLGDAVSVLSHLPATILMCAAAIYLTIYIGCTDLERYAPKGDYSYGLYIYCFPIQQILNKLLNIHNTAGFLLNFSGSLAIATGFAIFSWHLIEKPCLGLRKRFKSGRPAPQTVPSQA
ncbi:beta-1,4-N-acetylglucosamine oligosaccharide 6-O-acetyltransferase NodX [Rhizobium sp. ERR 1071]|uniref:acyltransferase family protein n=1 Tax=Rhizobium sp. ERR 1071 TaxID=2572677 RepID=UPI00119B7B30|nr:acyltransferase [Rhizobium sp. ERR1071]TWB20029.1 beta-1,4-N-acetylglucosamine oligosaccharide 6-O-acetyltransferase NodX [Rhizobium sp. ERR1071]